MMLFVAVVVVVMMMKGKVGESLSGGGEAEVPKGEAVAPGNCREVLGRRD